MAELQVFGAVAKDAENVGRKVDITAAGSGAEDIDADPRGRVEVGLFDSFVPGVKSGAVVEGPTSCIQEVEPERSRNQELSAGDSISQYFKCFVKFLDITQCVDYHVVEPWFDFGISFSLEKLDRVQCHLELAVSDHPDNHVMPPVFSDGEPSMTKLFEYVFA